MIMPNELLLPLPPRFSNFSTALILKGYIITTWTLSRNYSSLEMYIITYLLNLCTQILIWLLILSNKQTDLIRDCCAKFATGLNIKISHSSKSIQVIKLSFFQNDSPMGETFWPKDSLITHILFELWLIMIFSPVANFAQQSLHMFFVMFS